MAGARTVNVKNTFIDLPDESAERFHLTRQFSDPSPSRNNSYSNFMLEIDAMSLSDEDVAARDLGSQESTGGSNSDVALNLKQELGRQSTEEERDQEVLRAQRSRSQREEESSHIMQMLKANAAKAERQAAALKFASTPPSTPFASMPPSTPPQAQAQGKEVMQMLKPNVQPDSPKGRGKGEKRGGKGREERQQPRSPPSWDGATTVMMRNLPNKYKQQMLLDEIAQQGFQTKISFDFLYLPMDHNAKANLGYCFINFCEPDIAWAFGQAFEGKKMRHFHSSKVVVVMPASMQGFQANYAYYANSRVAQAEDPQYRPLFFKEPEAEGEALTATRSGGKGRGGTQQAAIKERSGKRGDNANGGEGQRLEALHTAGNREALYGNSWGEGGYVMEGGCAKPGCCALCGTEVFGQESICVHCSGFSPQAQRCNWADSMGYGAGDMMMQVPNMQMMVQDGCAYMDHDQGLQMIAPR